MNNMRSIDSPLKLNPMMSFVLAAVAALCGVSPAANAGPLPTGGHFVAGTGSIGGNGTSMTINQSSRRGVIDWTSFSVGFGNRVDFNNGTGATLNRVTGGDLSMILGSLSATGSLYLINPQGVVVGPSGIVSTGGRFVASTLDADNTAFMNGGPLTLTGHSDKGVINFGKIGSTGGDVFLVSSKDATNLGSISAPNGSAELATGHQVLLQDSSSSRQVFVQVGSGGTVFNAGTIKAAQVSLQAADGNVYALSGNHAALRATGTATRDGHVWLVADTGTVNLAGTLESKNADGSGGTVDTNAGNLVFTGTPTVSAGTWNITTPNMWLTDAAAASFSRSLNAGTSVNVQTTGIGRPNGDIDVASNIGWNGAASLNLGADHELRIDKGVTIKNQGSGNLTLRADAGAIDNGGSVFNSGTVDWSKSTGLVSAYYDMNGSYLPGTLLSNASWTSPAYSGLVTQITGYKLVNSLADLENINTDLAGNYALGRNIDASATSDGSFVPIGNELNPYYHPFTGQLDGRGYRISSLHVQLIPPWEGSGLFGVIGTQGVVRNITVSGSMSGTGMNAVGLLAGVNNGLIVGANTEGVIADHNGLPLAGGLVGTNAGTIERSSSSVDLSVNGSAGGLVGANNGAIAQSFSTGTIALDQPGETSEVVGGLAAFNYGSITQSYATGATQAVALCQPMGGGCSGGPGALVSVNTGTIAQSFATSPNSGDGQAGIAWSNSGTIGSDVYWNMDTTGANVGVLAGTPVPAANGLTTAQMSTPSSFVGYDFGPNGIWAMPSGATHPVLAWQAAPH